MPEYEYRRIVDAASLERLWRHTVAQGLMPTLHPEGDVTLDQWLGVSARADVLVLGGYVDGVLGGYLVGFQLGAGPTRVMEVSVCSFREHVRHAAALSRGGYLWCFDNLDCASILGRVIETNRHVLRMAPSVGFSVLGRVPGMFWSNRRQRFMAGYIVMATRESVVAAMEENK